MHKNLFNLDNVFYKTVLSTQRAYDLSSGVKSLLKSKNKPIIVALEELEQDLLSPSSLISGLIHRCGRNNSQFGYVPTQKKLDVNDQASEQSAFEQESEEQDSSNPGLFADDNLDPSQELVFDDDSQEDSSMDLENQIEDSDEIIIDEDESEDFESEEDTELDDM